MRLYENRRDAERAEQCALPDSTLNVQHATFLPATFPPAILLETQMLLRPSQVQPENKNYSAVETPQQPLISGEDLKGREYPSPPPRSTFNVRL